MYFFFYQDLWWCNLSYVASRKEKGGVEWVSFRDAENVFLFFFCGVRCIPGRMIPKIASAAILDSRKKWKGWKGHMSICPLRAATSVSSRLRDSLRPAAEDFPPSPSYLSCDSIQFNFFFFLSHLFFSLSTLFGSLIPFHSRTAPLVPWSHVSRARSRELAILQSPVSPERVTRWFRLLDVNENF